MTFFGKPKNEKIYEHIHESPKAMVIPLIVLAGLSFWIWYGANPIDPANGWFMKSWAQTPTQIVPKSTAPHFRFEFPEGAKPANIDESNHQEILEHKTHEVAGTGMIISILCAITGIALAWFMYLKNTALPDRIAKTFAPLYKFSLNKWYFDEFYEFAFVGSFMLFARMCSWFDTNIIDGIVNGVGRSTVLVSKIGGWIDKYIVDGLVNLTAGITQLIGLGFRSVQTGKIQTYLTWTLVGVVLVFAAIAWKLL
jgi:NADH-quinone oxidoreductase subunit L